MSFNETWLTNTVECATECATQILIYVSWKLKIVPLTKLSVALSCAQFVKERFRP